MFISAGQPHPAENNFSPNGSSQRNQHPADHSHMGLLRPGSSAGMFVGFLTVVHWDKRLVVNQACLIALSILNVILWNAMGHKENFYNSHYIIPVHYRIPVLSDCSVGYGLWEKSTKQEDLLDVRGARLFLCASDKRMCVCDYVRLECELVTWKAERSSRAKLLRKRMPCRATWMTPGA